MVAEAREDEGAAEVDNQGAESRGGEQPWLWRDGVEELFDGSPDRSDGGYEQYQSEKHADAGTGSIASAQGEEDEQVERGIFQEIDAVSEQGDRADSARHGEFEAEERQIGERHAGYGARECGIDLCLRGMLRCVQLEFSLGTVLWRDFHAMRLQLHGAGLFPGAVEAEETGTTEEDRQ